MNRIAVNKQKDAASSPQRETSKGIPKARTGIHGLDEITGGGLPQGRPTLVCGGAGCGKTLFAIEFIVRGIIEYGEPAVIVSFEESPAELSANVRSLGFDLDDLVARNLLVIEHIPIEPAEIEETGEYDLEGLFIRLGYAIDSVGAKRVALDTLEALFGGMTNDAILRSELRRLFRWLKDRDVTAVITGERGDGSLTRKGLEEYVSDCVILLDHRVQAQVTTRRLRIVKYRGTVHGTNEYPFLICEDGFSVLPVTSLALQHQVSDDRISSGIAELDDMLGGSGFFRGSTILISGTAGAGKTSLAAHLAEATCRRNERCAYFSFEESQAQVIRNMKSIGLDLQSCAEQGHLFFHMARPTLHGLEAHLVDMHKVINKTNPDVVIVDPLTNLSEVGTTADARAMLVRLLDFLKFRGITALFTSLTSGGAAAESTAIGVSSLMDTWILLRDAEQDGERNRILYVLKSRGMAHSNQLREFVLTPDGVRLIPAYVGPNGVLTGSARLAQQARDRATSQARSLDRDRQQSDLDRKRRVLEARIAALRTELEADAEVHERNLAQSEAHEAQTIQDREQLARHRNRDRDKMKSPNGRER